MRSMGSKESQHDKSVEYDDLQSHAGAFVGYKLVIWKIKNFSCLCVGQDRKLKSPSFLCGDVEWSLQTYSSDDTKNNLDEYVSIYIIQNSSSVSELNVSFIICLKDANGQDQNTIEGHHVFAKDGSACGGQVIGLNQLLEEREELLPNDTLTLICGLNIHYGSKLKHKGMCLGLPIGSADLMCKDVSTLLKSKRNCDVTIHVGGEEFLAHKLILGARTAVFAAMFENDMQKRRTNKVTITDMKPAIFGDMLTYIYSGNDLQISNNNVRELYSAADKYDLKELKGICRDFLLAESLFAETFCDIVALADLYNDGEMINGIMEFAANNFSEVVCTEEWNDFLQVNPQLATNVLRSVTLLQQKKEKNEKMIEMTS